MAGAEVPWPGLRPRPADQSAGERDNLQKSKMPLLTYFPRLEVPRERLRLRVWSPGLSWHGNSLISRVDTQNGRA